MPDQIQSLTLVCHLERIGPTYVSSPAPAPYIDFWIGLSAGYQSSPLDEDDPLRLKSWLWSAWKSITFSGIPAGGGAPVAIAADVTLLNQPSVPTSTFLASLETAFNRCQRLGAAAGFDPFQLDANPVVTPDAHHWNAFLGSASTWPGGLNQWMQLSLNFRIPADQLKNYTSIFAAPSIEPANPQPRPIVEGQPARPPFTAFPVRRVPDPAGLAQNQSGEWEWQYKPASTDSQDTSPKIIAKVNACAVVRDIGPDPIADLQTLQARKTVPPYAIPSISVDWTESLDSKVAELFDLPHLLLQALAENIAPLKPAPPVWAVDEGFHQLFLASLHDVANSGLFKEPSGATLFSEIAILLGYNSTDASLAKAALTNLNNSLYTVWIDELTAALSSVLPANQMLLPDWPKGGIDADPAGYLQDMNQLYALVLQPETLHALVLNRWTKVLQTVPSPALGTSAAAKIGVYLDSIQLRKRLLLGLLGRFWTEFSFTDEAGFKLQVVAAIKAYCLNRSVAKGAADLVPWPSLVPANADKIATDASDLASAQLDSSIVSPVYSGSSPAIEPEGLLIPLAGFQTQTAAGAYDLHQSLAGAGLLLRRIEDPPGPAPLPWKVLNFARVTDVNGDDLVDPVPVPIRLQYRNGVSSAFAFYQNLPLATGDPVPGDTFSPPSDDEADKVAPIFRLSNAYYKDPKHPEKQLKLEGLQYGQTYEAAPYYIGHGGHLPAVLTDASAAVCLPWIFKLPAPDANVGPTGTTIFHRKRSVGSVRLAQPLTADSKSAKRLTALNIPAIPPEVRTLAESVAARKGLDSTKKGDPVGAIILLTPPERTPVAPAKVRQDWNDLLGKTFSFQVYPPSVDLPTWQRWIGFDQTTEPMRSKIRSAWHTANASYDKKNQDKADPDDPAIKQVVLIATNLHGSGDITGDNTYVMTFPGVQPNDAFDPKNPLKWVQADPWTVTINSAAPGSTLKIVPDKDAKNRSVTVYVPEGEVWQFQLRPRAASTDQNCFEPSLWPYVFDTANKLSANGEISLRVEVASLWPGEAADATSLLYSAFQPIPVSAGSKLILQLDPGKADRATDARLLIELIQSATLYVQRWRWNGRPVYQQQDFSDPSIVPVCGYPFSATSIPSDGEDEPMDGMLFGDRVTADRYELSRTIDFLRDDTNLPVLEERNLATLPGALYFRFGVHVKSRYAPLILTDSELDTLFDGNAQSTEHWRRALVPCRFLGTLPVPSIRLIVPLTSALTPPDASAPFTPPLALLFNDRWFRDDLAGLAEQLEGEILQVALPEQGAGVIPQFGPDPILTTVESPYAGLTVSLPTAIGPIGNTFDTDTDAPLFLHTSFVQPPPTILNDTDMPLATDLSWHFLQVRYRRVLHPKAVMSGLSNKSMFSDWTDPVWVQMLPPANRWQLAPNGRYTGIDNLVCDYATRSVHTVPAYGDTTPPETLVPSESPTFAVFLLIMRATADAFGRPGQESYISFFPLKDFASQAPLAGQTLNARLVEVQHRANFTPNKETIFDALFPAASNRPDTSARIVRVSPPIAVI